MSDAENKSVVLPVQDAEQVLVAVLGIGRYEASNRLAAIDSELQDEIVAAYKSNDLKTIESILSAPSPE